jgi:hypothetical protein
MNRSLDVVDGVVVVVNVAVPPVCPLDKIIWV